MTDYKISQLVQATPASNDLIPFVDIDDTSTPPAGAGGSDKATTVANLPVSGRYLCTPTSYAPGTRAQPATTSGTMSAVSSANVNTGSFTAPASGSVMVTVSLVVFVAVAAGATAAFALAAHGTVSPLLSNVIVFQNNNAPNLVTMNFLVTGLTAGNSYNFDLLFSAPDGQSVTIDALGQTTVTPAAVNGAPVLMSVQAV